MHSILIVGAALVGLPILLHLIMKREPKRLSFPAFRFLKQKLRTNQRKLRLRHLLLLALRMLLIALFCLALYQPTLYSERLNIRGEQPLAVVLVIDTSPSMGYTVTEAPNSGETRPREVSRLEDARRRAAEFARELPDGSRVAVVVTGLPAGTETDTAAGVGKWLRSRDDAARVLDGLKEPTGTAKVTTAIGEAYSLLKTVDADTDASQPLQKLVAVFTDRATACWEATQGKGLVSRRDEFPDPKPVHVVVDVGVETPANVAILSADTKPQIVPANQAVVVAVTVGATGPDVEAEVLVNLDGINRPELTKTIAIPGGRTRSLSFEFRNLPRGLHQVQFALKTPDSLPADDTRFLTFRTTDAQRILTIVDEARDAQFWRFAHEAKGDFDCPVVTPDAVRISDGGRTVVEVPIPDRPGEKKLEPLTTFEVVCLLAVAHPDRPATNSLWDKLTTYVDGGGKLIVVPGADDRITAEEYRSPAARKLLPGTLERVVNTRLEQPEPAAAPPGKPRPPDRRGGVTWLLDDEALKTDLLDPLKQWKQGRDVDFVVNPRRTNRYWEVKKSPDASVIVSYDDSDNPKDRRPAVLERQVGPADSPARGRVILLTTRLDQPPGQPRDQDWHDYWETEGSSWYLVFPYLLVRHTAGETGDFNHTAGDWITVPIARLFGDKRENLALNGPGIASRDGIVSPSRFATMLKLGPPSYRPRKESETPTTDTEVTEQELEILGSVPGNYTITGPAPDWKEGFSLNLPPPPNSESNLSKVEVSDIEELTGPNSVIPVGKNLRLRDAIESKFDQPVDLFPWLLLAVLFLLAGEGLLANRFYRQAK